MTKARKYCESHEAIAAISLGLVGIEIYWIEYGIDDYVYCEYTGDKSYHKCKIKTNTKGESYFNLYGRHFYFHDALRTNIQSV